MVWFSKFDKVALVFLVVVVGVIFVSAFNAGSSSRPWHPLQQVSTNDTTFVSVDVDADGNIDFANKSDQVKCSDGAYKTVNDCIASGSGITTPSPCGANQVLKRNVTNDAWVCAEDLTGGAGGEVLPDCEANEYIKRNDTDTAWICVDTIVQNQISSVPVSNFSVVSPTSAVFCNAVNADNYQLLFDGTYSNAIYCQDKSGDDYSNKVASIIIDLGAPIRNGLVFIDSNFRRTTQTGGSCESMAAGISVNSSFDGSQYTQIDTIATASSTFSDEVASGTFSGRYLKLNFYANTYICDGGGGTVTAKGEFYLNEVEIYSFSE